MSTGKEIAARVAAECGGVKTWQERSGHEMLPVTMRKVHELMQAEIDELRSENARLKSALLTNDTTIESANNAAGMLEAENARLQGANDLLDNALIAAFPMGATGLVFELWNAARAALGEKS